MIDSIQIESAIAEMITAELIRTTSRDAIAERQDAESEGDWYLIPNEGLVMPPPGHAVQFKGDRYRFTEG